MSSENVMSFKNAYDLLKRSAQRLREGEEIDIDQVVPIVEQASRAFSVIKERIEAPKKALAEHLPQNGEEV